MPPLRCATRTPTSASCSSSFKVNFSAYLNEYRVNKARQLILDPRLSLKDIGAAVGYSDANYFTRVFKRLTGQTPSEYRVAAAEKAAQG